MFVMLIDFNNYICEWAGCKSVLELPIFSESLYSLMYKNISRLSFEQLYVCSRNFSGDMKGSQTIYVDGINEISAKPRELILILFSDRFIDIDEGFVSLIKSANDNCKIVSENGDIISVVLSYEHFNSLHFNYTDNPDKNFDFINDEAVFDGYCKKITEPYEYKEFLTDILNKKTTLMLPEIAEGIFVEEKLPQGNFSIIPPVYFDKDIQVESGSVIGPNSILMKDILVSSDSNIKNSVLYNGCFVSSGCFIDDVLMFDNVSVRRNSVILNGSVLGHNSFVGEESVVEVKSFVKPYTRIDEFKENYVNFKTESNQSPAGFYGYAPEKAALLGAALGKVFEQPKIAVAGDGELNSTALKLALLGGLITTGAAAYDFGNSFLSSLHYYMSFCELDCGVFVSGNNMGTVITVFEKWGCSLTLAQYHNIKTVMLSENIERCDVNQCKSIRQIHGMSRMYIQNLIKDFSSRLDFMPVFYCDNKRILSIVDIALSKIGYKICKDRIVFHINYDGTKVTAEYDNMVFSYNKLIEIVSFYDKSDESLKLWENDSVYLCFELLKVLKNNNMNLRSAVKSLPLFYVAENTVPYNGNISALLNKVGEKGRLEFVHGDICLSNGENRLKINKNENGFLRITAKSKSMEIAKELVGDLIKNLS